MSDIMNSVIIRVWARKGDNVGHASLQTRRNGVDSKYVSFWPAASTRSFYANSWFYRSEPSYCSQQEHNASHIHTLADDITAEQRQAEFQVELTILDVDAIEAEYEKIVQEVAENKLSWSLLGGSNWYENYTQSTCSLLCARLLIAGGINDLFIKPIEHYDLAIYFGTYETMERFGWGMPEYSFQVPENAEPMGRKQFWLYIESFRWEFALGSSFVSRVFRPKPFDIALFAVKALKAEHELKTNNPYILRQNGHFIINPSPPELPTEIKSAESVLRSLHEILPKSKGSLLVFQYNNVVNFHYDHFILNSRFFQQGFDRGYGIYPALEPDAYFRCRIGQYLEQHNIYINLPDQKMRTQPGWYAKYFLSINGVHDIHTLRAAQKAELAFWQENCERTVIYRHNGRVEQGLKVFKKEDPNFHRALAPRDPKACTIS